MSLLRDIQNSAVDANEPIGTLLRKCKILAARLGNEEFEVWVERELNGYCDKNSFPKYGILNVASKGYFSGGFGSGMKNADIPMLRIDERFREQLFISYLSQPVSSIESLIKESDGTSVQEPWPSDVTALFGTNIYQNMNCLQAWKVIPVNTLVGVIDMIRSRVLNFVLKIEAEDPEAGDAPLNSKPVAEEKIKQIFNTYISGDVQNVATGSTGVEQNAHINKNSDVFSELIRSLDDVGANEQITGVVKDMRDSKDTNSYSLHYKEFMSMLSDHMQVYGPAVAPFLPALTAMLS